MKLSKLFVTTLFLVLALSVTVYAKKHQKGGKSTSRA